MLMDTLEDLPVGAHVEYQSEVIFLNVFSSGSELGVELYNADAEAMLDSCLEIAFLGVRDFDAGLCMGTSNKTLFLTQWIPHVKTWLEVSETLEKLLIQAEIWRLMLNTSIDHDSPYNQTMIEEVHLRNRILNTSMSR